MKPQQRPNNPNFSSGPCSKRPGWSVDALSGALVGRSHRSKEGKARLKDVIERSKSVLGLPDEWRLGIVPASDTGAVEMVLWAMLGARGVDMVAWESFGKGWITDVVKQLKLEDVRIFEAGYGELPDLTQTSSDRDIVLTWNGTTSGVRVPNGDWIADDREGLVIADSTSAAFAMDLPWDKLDVVTWSWQKALGGEAAHGMLALSPRAVERLLNFDSGRPLPKIFRLLKKGALNEGVFVGNTINTPSMLCVEDALDALKWAESVGGLAGLKARSEANLAAISKWVDGADHVEFLATDPASRSSTSVCLVFTDSRVAAMDAAGQKAFAAAVAGLLGEEGVGYDIKHYRDAPAGLRIWCGCTVETSDVEALLPWIDWAFEQVIAS